jgi:hypothetical protein
MVILDLTSLVHLASFVMRLIKQLKYTIFFGRFDLLSSALGTVVSDSHRLSFTLLSIPQFLPISVSIFNMLRTTVSFLVISTTSSAQ